MENCVKNSVVQWQIVTPEADSTAKFYGALFGWKVTTSNALGYREVNSSNGKGIDGGVWPAPAGVKPFVQLFVEVEDVDATIAAAAKLGATVIVPKSALPDGDVMAVLADPSGITFGVMTSRASG
jgi:uncharacterized protein